MSEDRIKISRHEVIPHQGSFRVDYPDGRQSVWFYWEDDASRRAVNKRMTQEEAKLKAQELARKG